LDDNSNGVNWKTATEYASRDPNNFN